MRRQFKRMLSVVLSVLMLMSCFVVAAPVGSAIECTEHDFEFDHSVDPTCVQGYDVYVCSVCKAEEKRNFTDPIAEHHYMYHDTVAPTCTRRGYKRLRCSVCAGIVVDKDSYVPMLPHTYDTITYDLYDTENQYYRQTKICSVCEDTVVTDEFYKVELVKMVKNGDVLTSVPVETAFAPKGGTTLYSGTPTLSLAENDDYAKWKFAGWVKNEGDTASDLSSLSITEPTTLLAVFTGVDVYYNVTFYDYAGQKFGDTQRILYKHNATAPTNVTATYSNNHIIYEFAGWDKDFDSVTSDLYVNPKYIPHPEQITILFYGPDGNSIVKEWTGDYGTALSFIAPTAQEVAKPSDGIYVYEYTGKWANAGGEIQVSANKNLSLYPIYVKQTIKYDVSLRTLYNNLGSSNSSYQIIASNGNLAAAGFTNEGGRAEIKLAAGTYTVKCASSDKLQAGEGTFTVKTTGITVVDIVLVDNDQYYEGGAKTCTCICHTVIGGLWVKVLNLLYTLFNIRYVCCNDMYATHGDVLKYTA